MDEVRRLNLLRQYDLLDASREQVFDHVVAVAARVVAAPISLVTFVGEDRVWIKARHGVPDTEVGRVPGFCVSAVEQDDPWLVEDALADARCRGHPWVTGHFQARSYVGIPLKVPEGICVGTLCAIDRIPRRLNDADLLTLKELSALVVDKIVARTASRVAYQERELAWDAAGKLASRSRLLSAMVEASQDAIITTDLQGRVTSWNPAAGRLYGFTEAEMLGETIHRVIPEERRAEEQFVLGSILEGRKVERYETIRQHKSRRLLPVSLTVSPILDDQGAIVGASKIVRDITGERNSQAQIRSLLREVNHRVKNQYAVILSMVRLTSRTTSTKQEFESRVGDRIMALSRSHDLLVDADWRGSTIAEVIAAQIEPFENKGRVSSSGPSIMISPNAALYLGMALHELSATSAERGALTDAYADGAISVSWSIEPRSEGSWLRLVWDEHPSTLDRVAEGGFSRAMLRRIVPDAMSGMGYIQQAAGRRVWTLEAPLSGITGGQ
ncbi:PAS domain S-box protein [Mesorhizobium sp. CU2]|uniref:PAS domain S-box protein n=2 Tax=unclassified Mesorhizobium TaxID=325217 RepID=UPI0015E455BD|nr:MULTISPECIES: PAS domain S-box protein [unclassified Mesorhizobium]